MFLKRVKVDDFRVLKNVDLTFEPDFVPSTFPLGSLNGGGKSTLLQLIFACLHCAFDENKYQYFINLLSSNLKNKPDYFVISQFDLIHDAKDFSAEFILVKHDYQGLDFTCFPKMADVEYHLTRESLAPNERTEYEERGRELEKSIATIVNRLKLNHVFYMSLMSSDLILLCNTTESIEFLRKVSKKVFLAAPSTQVFLFFPAEEKKKLFSTENTYSYLIDTKKKLPELFTYDFASVSNIIESFKKARDRDFAAALESGNYGNNLQKLKVDLKSFLSGKIVTVNENLSQVIFKLQETGEELSPEDLSHGELKKLGIYVWLKYQEIENALVLMDEIEIGLHPDWQYEIANELQEWSHGNQFILT